MEALAPIIEFTSRYSLGARVSVAFAALAGVSLFFRVRRARAALQDKDKFADSIVVENYHVPITGRVLGSMPWIFKTVIGRITFYPTLFYNLIVFYCVGKQARWWNHIDDHVIIGALPFSSSVEKLHKEGVVGVINTCDEYGGPVSEYAKYQIEQYRAPTVDFTAPTLDQIEQGLAFIKRKTKNGGKVYVHCKAGKGRSATLVICYIMSRHNMTPKQAQRFLIRKRPQVSKYLWCRSVVIAFQKKCRTPVDPQ